MIDPTLKGHMPAYQCAILDRRTRGVARLVYVLLFEDLDLYAFTPVKVYRVHPLQISRRSAIQAMKDLVEWGYLEKGPPDPSGVHTYRLRWTCPVGSLIAPPRAS